GQRGRGGDATGDELLTRVAERLWRDDPLELPEGHPAPRERDPADDERQERRERRAEFERARVDLPRELQDRDERRGPATGAVEERNHLWHRSHLDHAGAHESGDPSHRDAGEDHRDPALHVRREEGCDDRGKHSRRGDAIAQNRGRWRRESLETQDESDGRDEAHVRGDDGFGRHAGTFSPTAFFVCSWTTSPSFVMTVPLMTSSFMSRLSLPSFVIMSASRLAMLREYIWLAWYGMVDGRFVVPSMRTPATSGVTPGSVSSVLPPVSAARSTITEPGFIDRTMSAVMSFGAGRPGI